MKLRTLVIKFWPFTYRGFSIQWSFDCWFWKLSKEDRMNRIEEIKPSLKKEKE